MLGDKSASTDCDAVSTVSLTHVDTSPVVCGSSSGTSPLHLAAARDLAHEFHRNRVQLVYGGGTMGMMGELARTLVSLSGPDSVHGFIPEALCKYEQDWNPPPPPPPPLSPSPGNPSSSSTSHNAQSPLSSTTCTPIDPSVYGRITIVRDMHTRKQCMARKVIAGPPGSGFVALSGGYGTFEELMEMTTWNQLGIHDRPIVIYNVNRYWDGLLAWIHNAVAENFVSPATANIIVEATSAPAVIHALSEYSVSPGRISVNWDNIL